MTGACGPALRDSERAHPIHWISEKGADGQFQVKQMFAELGDSPILSKAFRIGTLDFMGKEIVPLQAADTLAYEVFKQVENQIVDRGEKRGVRLSVKNLMRPQDPNYLKYWDRARLTEWLSECERRGC